jgi:small subunit ribosomal protein S18
MDEEMTTPAQVDDTPAAPQPERKAAQDSGPAAPRVRKDDDDGPGPRKMVNVGGGKDARGRNRRRRKVSYLTVNKIYKLDYKDTNLLRRFVNDQGKIVPSRQSGATATEQRMIANAIRRAREMALMPFVTIDTSANERRSYGDRERRPYRSRDNRDDGGGGYEGRSERPPRENRDDAAPAAPREAPNTTTE